MSDSLSHLEASIPALRRYARSLLRGPQDADDLVHDTLVRALDNFHAAGRAANFRAWLFAIMHNLFVSQLRRAKVRHTETLAENPGAEAGWRPAEQENGTALREILQAFKDLSDEQRQVLLLVCVEDFSYAEVAAVLRVPIGTVMSRLSRGRERLRQLVQEPAEPRAVLRRVK